MALSITSRTITPGWTLDDVVNDLMGTAIPALTHWGVGTDFGNGEGGIIQSADGDRELLLSMAGAGVDFHGYQQWGSQGTGTLSDSYSKMVYNRKDRSSIDIALNMFDGSSSGDQNTVILFEPASLVGAFENGEIITIATVGGNTTGTLVHWDLAGGMLVLTNVTNGAGIPAYGANWNAKAITSSISGATATTEASTYMPTTGWICSPPDHAYIDIVTGVAPTAGQTVTGSVSGVAVIAGAGTPYAAGTGKLTLATVPGNLLRSETVTWTGGTGVVRKMMPVWDIAMFATADWSMTSVVDSSAPVIIFEDETRLCILVPNTATHYYSLMVGDWFADLYGGTQDIASLAVTQTATSIFSSTNTYGARGIIMAYDGEVVRGLTSSMDTTQNSFRGAGGVNFAVDPVVADSYLGSYVGSDDYIGASWLAVGPMILQALQITLPGDDLDAMSLLGIGRSLAFMNTGDPVKTIFSDSGSNRRWLKFDYYTSIEFTSDVITP